MATVPFASQLPAEWRQPARVNFDKHYHDRGLLEYDDGTTVVFSLYQKYYQPHMCLMLGIQARHQQLECLYDFIPYTDDPNHRNYWKPQLPRSAEEFCTKANTHGFRFREAHD